MGAVFVQAVVNYFVGVAFTAWGLMLSAGAAHHNWWPQMPLMGYGDAVGIVMAGSLPVVILALIIWGVIAMVAQLR